MAYICRGIPLRDVPHLWAETCKSSAGQQPSKLKLALPQGRHGVTVTVTWEGELYSVKIGAARWRRIRYGEAVTAQSTGWREDQSILCSWYFDDKVERSLTVDFGDSKKPGFSGDIRDAWIHPRRPGEKT